MKTALARPVRAIAVVGLLASLAGLAGCGKVASPEYPPHATYPKTYPVGAVAAGTAAQKTALQPPETTGPAFTARGAWIDPDTRRRTIDPYADRTTQGIGSSLSEFGGPNGASP